MNKYIKDLIYLRKMLDERIDEEIEAALSERKARVSPQKLEESLNYRIEERFRFIKMTMEIPKIE